MDSSSAPTSGVITLPPDVTIPPQPSMIAPFTSEEIADKKFVVGVFQLLKHRFRNDPYFKWVLIGGSLYIITYFTPIHEVVLWPLRTVFQYVLKKAYIPNSLITYMGGVEHEIPFGRLGYTRCLECDSDVLEKFGIPMNAKKCLRDGISYIPGEFYQQFDINEFDSKVTPMTWSYGPISDPSLIMPVGWYNDMSGENIEFESFCRYMRIFGYLPQSAYHELFQHCTIRLLRSDHHLIRIGDPDDKVYIIICGAVDVYSNRIGPHGDFIRLRTALHAGQISSLFSIIDALSGYSRSIRSIYAISKLNTTKVLIFPIAALKDYLVRNPEYLVSAIVRVLERGYRFQYRILHKGLQLTGLASVLDTEPMTFPPCVEIPPEGEPLSEAIREDAIRDFMNFLKIDDFDFVNEVCRVLVIEPEEPCNDKNTIKESVLNQPESAYKYVYVGKLEEFHLKSNLGPLDQHTRRKVFEEVLVPEPLARICSGQGVGGLTGILSYSDVLFTRCVERSIVVLIDHHSLITLLKRKPLSILPFAYMVTYRMSLFIRAMDFAMEWTLAKDGQYIFHKEQMCYDSYFILSGRARAYQLDSEWEPRAILEYKENDWVGVIESLLQSKRRSKTCVVIRETEFVKIPNDLLRNIIINYSSAAQVILNRLAQRSLKSRMFELHDMQMDATIQESPIDIDTYRESRRIHTICLVPVAENLPYSILASEIKRHFSKKGKCAILTYKKAITELRISEITYKHQFQLEMYILEKLESNDLIIFICLPKIHYWNELSCSHSELIFTVACSELPNIPTEPPDYEEEIVGKKISSKRKELIILHRMDVALPTNTKEWLYYRDWVHFHHHIRLPLEAFDLLGAIPEEEIAAKYTALYRQICFSSDLSRLARWLEGRTFGVLFSSGGARIGAQLGMLQAVLECKHFSVDMVVGTGAGFLIAALYAVYCDYLKVQQFIEKVFKDFQDLTKTKWTDFNFFYITTGNGKRLLTYFYQMFGSAQLEDTWIPICCVTTNLTSQDVRVDRSGPIWVFVRASLSHLCKSPPISDPIDGDYICDGAHANSLPQDIIKEYGAEYIFAFNTVNGKSDDLDTSADPNVSIFRYIKSSLWNFVKEVRMANPSFETVYSQLAITQTRMYASGVESVSNLKHVVYVRPPVEHMNSQNWANLPSLHRIGYFFMKAILDKNEYNPDMPFFVYWSNVKNTAHNMATQEGIIQS